MDDFDKWFNENRKELGVTKFVEKRVMKAAWEEARRVYSPSTRHRWRQTIDLDKESTNGSV
jgi:hypothetical protein